MPFTRSHFLRHRPYLYHYMLPGNRARLCTDRAMHSAASWVARANAFQPQIPDVAAFLVDPRPAPQLRDRLVRGPDFFTSCDGSLMVKQIAEVVFPDHVVLPDSTEWRDPGNEEWAPLFPQVTRATP